MKLIMYMVIIWFLTTSTPLVAGEETCDPAVPVGPDLHNFIASYAEFLKAIERMKILSQERTLPQLFQGIPKVLGSKELLSDATAYWGGASPTTYMQFLQDCLRTSYRPLRFSRDQIEEVHKYLVEIDSATMGVALYVIPIGEDAINWGVDSTLT